MNADAIARERCTRLMALAKEAWREGKRDFSRRCVRLARKLAMRHRFSLGGKSFCKECNAPFIPGATLKVRLDSSRKLLLLICKECGAEKKTGYARKRP